MKWISTDSPPPPNIIVLIWQTGRVGEAFYRDGEWYLWDGSGGGFFPDTARHSYWCDITPPPGCVMDECEPALVSDYDRWVAGGGRQKWSDVEHGKEI